MGKYYNRLIENKLKSMLETSGAVSIVGPKYCGKSTTCNLFQKSKIELISTSTINLVKSDPKIALNGDKPRMIDEWQVYPDLWNLIRQRIDEDNSFSEYILTGSATPPELKDIHHSGAGRIVQLQMRTMSLFESNDSKGTVSLKELFNNKNYWFFDENKESSLENVAFLISRGGWPKSVLSEKEKSIQVTKNYFDGLFNFENDENSFYKNKKSEITKRILKSYARNISTEASYQTILTDVNETNNSKLDIKTFDSYVDMLKNLFIIEDMEAWCPKIRSKARIRNSSTRHFIDPSLAMAALGIGKNELLNDFETFGLFFEDLAVRDLRVYAETLNGKVTHYRDSSGLECDAVIHLENGEYGLIEIKMGSDKGIEEGATHLLKLKDNIDSKIEPSFLLVLTANSKAYKRNDGVYVVPINCLKD